MKKARAFKTKIESFKTWKSHGWIEVNGSDGKLYVEPSPLEAKHKTYYDVEQLKTKYNEYVSKSLRNQRIELMYELHQKCFECTLNTWEEVDSLGVTIHSETEGIWSQLDVAKNVNAARYQFAMYNDVEYENVRGRRNPVGDLWILNEKYTRNVFQLFDKELLQMMLNATGNQLGKPFDGYRNRYQVDFSERWESLIGHQIAYKTDHQGMNFYALTDLGLSFIKLILPTRHRIMHSENLNDLIKNRNTNLMLFNLS